VRVQVDEESWHCLGPVSRFSSGRAQSIDVAGRRLAVGSEGGRFFAVDDECPHGGARLSAGRLREGALVCPLHFWEFEVFSGKCLRFGAQVTSHPVRVEDAVLWVRI
jgi:nitrite reductase/ring-hydroxylating ferredoxin subunit